MFLKKALSIVLDLASENVLEDDLIDGPEGREEQKEQDEACEMVANFLKILRNDDLAENFGEDIIKVFGLKKMQRGPEKGRVMLQEFGTKTPVGVAKVVFRLLEDKTKQPTPE